MKEQISFINEDHRGILYLVPTPIGNLEDMTYRAVRILTQVELIAAEDTRQTMKLLRHFNIKTDLTSYHEHNKRKSGLSIIEQLKKGKQIALVSDAGMPAISDPGEELVAAALDEEIRVIALPGANAGLTALVASGLSTQSFQFIGFLPRQNKQRLAVLEGMKLQEATLLFYESPHRLKETLQALFTVFGNRKISIGRELTKKFEEYQRGTLEEAIAWCEHGTIKGEFVLVVEGSTGAEDKEQWWMELTEKEHVSHYIEQGLSSKEAIKKVALERNVPKREIYSAFHQTDD